MVSWHYRKTVSLGKIWFSNYSQKLLSTNEISMFFNRQYFINRLISDFDFWHVDRHEWKEQQVLLTCFLEKLSGSALTNFLKILLNEKGQKIDESNINGFYLKNFLQGKWTISGRKMAYTHNSGSVLRSFLKFCTMKGADT